LENGAVVTVEVFPRANGNTLVTAFSDQAPLPFDPAAVAPEPGEIDHLQAICERLSPEFRAEKIIALRRAQKRTPARSAPVVHPPPRKRRQDRYCQALSCARRSFSLVLIAISNCSRRRFKNRMKPIAMTDAANTGDQECPARPLKSPNLTGVS
jgi:hypothetical protein